jgi:predicted O-methyltransferase YrrM
MSNKFYTMRTPDEVEGLEDMIRWINEIRPTSEMRMIEIGSYIGESTMIFAKHFKEVVSVDPYMDNYDVTDMACSFAPFDDVYSEFLRNTLDIPNIKSIRDTSERSFSILKEREWDLVYIDGLHTVQGVMFDIDNYRTIISKGGFVSGHDYGWGNVRHSIGIIFDDKVDGVFKDHSWIKGV